MSRKTKKVSETQSKLLEAMNGGTLINFYELEEMKKYLPKIDDKQVEYTGMPLHQHFLLVGGTGSGKTLSFLNYLALTSIGEGTYKKILMCVKKLEPPNLFLKEKLGDALEFFLTVESFPNVKDFADLGKRNTDSYLVVFDDCINDSKNPKVQKKIDEFFTYGRSKGITIAYLTQSYYGTPIFIRRQVSFVLLCSIKTIKELKMILKDYNIGDINFPTLNNIYQYATSGPKPHFLKICTYECEPNKKFSRNFIEYLNPDDFYEEETSKTRAKRPET